MTSDTGGNDGDDGWSRVSHHYNAKMQDTLGSVERLRLLHNAPMFSFWSDIKQELLLAADEITNLRRRLEEKSNDGG